MSLQEYARKRTFSKTPEPAPQQTAPARGNRYCIQRHAARSLHYDLRLEVGGALKSWAIPQGPSLDPADKRLAVMVEDHPLEYGSFEGNIPKGNYGAGSVMLWDEGTFELLGDAPAEEQLERGDLKFRLHGRKLSGEFAIVRMKGRGKGNEWLLLKKKDTAARPGWDIEKQAYSVATGRTQEEIAQGLAARSSEAAMPKAISPMLAYSSDTPPTDPGWVFEVKWDGVRALCYIRDGGSRLVSRKGTSIDAQYPELSAIHDHFDGKTAILDGEIAVLDEEGRPSFNRIQPRIMASGASAIARMAQANPAIFFAFDLLYLDGEDLRGKPLVQRKHLLASRIRPNPVLRYSEHFEAGVELLELARQQGLEGIVAKRADSAYVETRSKDWIKIKVFHEQDFVLCGFTEGERDYFGALVLGIYDEGVLRFAGSVGTGFDRKMMQAIHERLSKLAIKKCPLAPAADLPKQATWVRPELVCSVKYHSWTEAEEPVNRRLRSPVFVGLRPDIDPKECRRAPQTAVQRMVLLPGDKDEAAVKVEGRTIRIKNLNKVFYPQQGYTKRDLLNYYAAVADLLLPHWTDRPLSLRRYPDGIGKEGFFQKRADIGGLPEWIRTERIIAEDGKEREQVIGGSRAELIYLTNLGCIDQNPWMSRVQSLDNPDFVLIDLDPHECGFDKIVEAAQHVRRQLEKLGLTGYPKTTGGDGMHIYVPLEPIYTYDMSKAFAEILSRLAAAERPDLFTTPRAVARREKGKVYFDHMQNGRGKTISAPYVLRAYDGAPVATPLEWREVVPGLHPKQFHIRNVLDRFDRTGDLFAGVLKNRQRLEPAMEKFAELLGA
jgi:bifunctional non-homologous end joining protein LigD